MTEFWCYDSIRASLIGATIMHVDRRRFAASVAVFAAADVFHVMPAAAAPLMIVGELPPNFDRCAIRNVVQHDAWIFEQDGDRQAIAHQLTAAVFVKRPQPDDPHALQFVGANPSLSLDRPRLVIVGHAARFIAQDASSLRLCRCHEILFQHTGSEPNGS